MPELTAAAAVADSSGRAARLEMARKERTFLAALALAAAPGHVATGRLRLRDFTAAAVVVRQLVEAVVQALLAS